MQFELGADEIIAQLGLKPHPEGGHFRETWRPPAEPGERSSGTAIYFLLQTHEVSQWHRVDAAEIWHWYAGAPLGLSISADGSSSQDFVLSNDLASGQPQITVPAGHWQSARTLGEWTLAGCTVSPGFEFEHFELAAPGWSPAN